MGERTRRVGAFAVGSFRTVLWLHAALAVAQPVAAGSMLQASVAGRAVHQGVGGVLLLVASAQVLVAILAWRPGGWPAWPIAVSATLWAAETLQLAVGYSGELWLHLPLGVAIVATAVVMAVWSLRARGRAQGRARPPGARRRAGDLDTLVGPSPAGGEDVARP